MIAGDVASREGSRRWEFEQSTQRAPTIRVEGPWFISPIPSLAYPSWFSPRRPSISYAPYTHNQTPRVPYKSAPYAEPRVLEEGYLSRTSGGGRYIAKS